MNASDMAGIFPDTEESAVYWSAGYQMSGNRISVRTLDLNCDFSEISAQLDTIVAEHFGDLMKRPA